MRTISDLCGAKGYRRVDVFSKMRGMGYINMENALPTQKGIEKKIFICGRRNGHAVALLTKLGERSIVDIMENNISIQGYVADAKDLQDLKDIIEELKYQLDENGVNYIPKLKEEYYYIDFDMVVKNKINENDVCDTYIFSQQIKVFRTYESCNNFKNLFIGGYNNEVVPF